MVFEEEWEMKIEIYGRSIFICLSKRRKKNETNRFTFASKYSWTNRWWKTFLPLHSSSRTTIFSGWIFIELMLIRSEIKHKTTTTTAKMQRNWKECDSKLLFCYEIIFHSNFSFSIICSSSSSAQIRLQSQSKYFWLEWYFFLFVFSVCSTISLRENTIFVWNGYKKNIKQRIIFSLIYPFRCMYCI